MSLYVRKSNGDTIEYLFNHDSKIYLLLFYFLLVRKDYE